MSSGHGRNSSASVCVGVTTALGTSPFLTLQERKTAQSFNSWRVKHWELCKLDFIVYLSFWFKKYPSCSCSASKWLNLFQWNSSCTNTGLAYHDISCSSRLNVSAWPQNQLWKTRCFFNYLKDSEENQPDLVSSLIWIEKYTLLCSPDERAHLQPAKCYFLIPQTCPGLKTSTHWGEIVF